MTLMQQMTEKENSLILYLFSGRKDKRKTWQLDSVLQYKTAVGRWLVPPEEKDGCLWTQQ